MYLSFFGLREKPFSIVPNPSFLFMSNKHDKALKYLEYGLGESNGFTLLTGDIGTGKTTLIRHLLQGINLDYEIAVIFNTNVEAADLTRMVLREYELESTGKRHEDLDILNSFLVDCYARQKRPLLIVDEAQNLSFEALEEVRMLSNLHTQEEHLIQIVLVGQPELRFRLQSPELAQLAQRITVSYHLGPLSAEEVAGYIKHRLTKAGAKNANIFDAASVKAIHLASGGIPRNINIICDAALVYAFADEQRAVNSEIIDQVVSDRRANGVFNLDPTGSAHKARRPSGDKAAPVSAPDFEGLGEIKERITRLEVLVQAHGDQLEQSRSESVARLEEELKRERKRGERLLAQCALYQSRIQAMERNLAEKQPEPKSSPAGNGGKPTPVPVEAGAPDTGEARGFFAWLTRG